MGITLASIGRYLCGLIDSIIYVVITKMYELFQDVSGIILYSQSIFDSIGQRIGLILGIFMLFRLAVSLINYMISPDKISDNSKGGAKMITNIIISLALLISVNLIFNEAYKVQKRVIESHFVEKIFFGKKAEMPNVNMGYILYSSFITPNINGCETLLDPYTEMNPTCSQELSKIQNTNINTALNNLLNTYELNKVYSNYDLLNYRLNNDWLFSYLPILSTVAGIAVVLVLISFCMDLATRAVKLLFLQIIAPIPIIANMDPAKGSEIFKKWYKECFNTYLSIFIRIIAINFAVFMITLIKTEFGNIFTGKSPLLTVLLVIGCLMFAKQVPKLIEDLLGIKLDGMSLKPLKKFQEKSLLGKQISGVATGTAKGIASGAIGIGTGALGAGIASGALGKKWWQTAGAIGIGAGRGLLGGFGEGYKSKNAIQAVKTGFGRYGENADYVNSLKNTDAIGRMRAGIQQRMHIATEENKIKDKLDALGAYDSAVDAMLKRSEAESVKKNDLKIKDSSGHDLTMEQHKQEQEKLNRLRNDIKDYEQYLKYEGINTNIASKSEWAQANNIKQGQFEDNSAFEKRVQKDYEQYVENMNRKIKESKTKYEEYKLNHDTELQKLNDKVNKDTKIFATTYASEVSKGNIPDGETLAYANRVKETYNDLKDYYQGKELEQFNVMDVDANGKEFVNGAKAKEGKQNAVTIKYETEHNYDSKDGKYNIYQREKANAAATKPKKGK